MANNELMKKMFENKDFMSNILKMKNRNEVQKAFENKGLEVTKNDVDALGKTLAKASGLADKCSKEELNVLAELFENLDSNSLAKVAGGGEDSILQKIGNFLAMDPKDRLGLVKELMDLGLITKDGKFTPSADFILNTVKSNDELFNAFRETIGSAVNGKGTPNKQKQTGSIGGNPTSAAPAATSSSSSNNTAMYVTAGGAVAVSLLGLAYAFRGKIKSWFN